MICLYEPFVECPFICNPNPETFIPIENPYFLECAEMAIQGLSVWTAIVTIPIQHIAKVLCGGCPLLMQAAINGQSVWIGKNLEHGR
jgi:hypothetical protein